MKRILKDFTFPVIVFLFASCTEENAEKLPKEIYDGPVRIGTNINMNYSEGAKKKSLIQAPLLNEFDNGDREFPEGIYIEFYDENEEIVNTLSANYAFFEKAENRWKVTGDVEIKNLQTDEQMNTEELFWEPDTGEIYNEKFVTIRSQNSLSKGVGIRTNQEFTEWTMDNYQGQTTIE